jgi:competence protein ComEA
MEGEERNLISIIKDNIVFAMILVFILGAGVMYLVLEEYGKSEGSGDVVMENNRDTDKEPVLSELLSSDIEESYIIVDLSGAVKNPGVYKLSRGARVADLIKAGGGISNEVSGKWVSRNLNLSRLLSESEKVYVPFEWEVPSSAPDTDLRAFVSDIDRSSQFVPGPSSSNTTVQPNNDNNTEVKDTNSEKINVNKASLAELKSLPGIGDVYGNRIIELRPHTDINDMKEKVKIPASTIEKIVDLITF